MIVAIAGISVPAVTAIVIFVLWIRRPRGDVPQTRVLMDRLVRIEQTLDAVAIEVERISEAQRFATKLLAERVREQPGTQAIAEPVSVPDRR